MPNESHGDGLDRANRHPLDRNKICVDRDVEALRKSWRTKRVTKEDLWRYAQICWVTNAPRRYTESPERVCVLRAGCGEDVACAAVRVRLGGEIIQTYFQLLDVHLCAVNQRQRHIVIFAAPRYILSHTVVLIVLGRKFC